MTNLPARIIPGFTPVPRQRMRRGGWSADRQREFIELLAETGSVRSACRRMGVGEHHIYKLRRHPEAASFRKAWEAALDIGVQRIEDVAMDRALNGVEEPVYHRGEIVGTRRAYNDRLLMFMLDRRAPERFGTGASDPGWKGRETARLAMKLRKEIREELEAEAKANAPTPEEIRAKIDAKIESLRAEVETRRQREWERLSEDTRAAWARFEALKDRDMERLAAEEEAERKLLAGPREQVNAEPPPKREPPEPRVAKTSWTVKDDRFDP